MEGDKYRDDRPHVVYRFYDERDRLLYVGITALCGHARWAGHVAKVWWPLAVRCTLEHVPGWVAAVAVERAAIDTEAPAYQTAHRGGCRVTS